MEKSLFILLRLGLGTSSIDKEDISFLLEYSEDQWESLERIAVKQGVAAIVLDGLIVIMDKFGTNCFNHFQGSSFWRRFISKWAVGIVEQKYEAGNIKQLRVASDVQKLWAKEGIRMMIMKGLSMGVYYPNPNHRSPGDIDCYLFEHYNRGNEVAKGFADYVDESWYKHSQIIYRGETIENHQFFVHTREGKSSKALNRILCESLMNVDFERLPDTDVLLPPPMFNALFLTYHSLTHFLEEGLHLKQIVDWAMFIKRDTNKVDWMEFYRICDKFHLRRFADILTDIAVNFLGVKLIDSHISSSSPYTSKVIQSTLFDEDYVFGSGKGNWGNRWHIITNLFKYRWKYHFVYQHTILRQLWFYASGFIFKTE